MKLNKQQTDVLAHRIVSEIKEKAKKQKFTKELEREMKAQISEVEKLYTTYREAYDKFNKTRASFCKSNKDFYWYEGTKGDEVLSNIKKNYESDYTTKIPSFQDVQQEIVLESVFSDEKDVQKFIDKLVKKYL